MGKRSSVLPATLPAVGLGHVPEAGPSRGVRLRGWANHGGHTPLLSPPTCFWGDLWCDGGRGIPFACPCAPRIPEGVCRDAVSRCWWWHWCRGTQVLPLPWWHSGMGTGTGTGAAQEHCWWQRGGGWHHVVLAHAEVAHARIRAVGQSSACQDGRAQLSSCLLGLCPPGQALAGLAPAASSARHQQLPSSVPKMPPPCWGRHAYLPPPHPEQGLPAAPPSACPAVGLVLDLGAAIPLSPPAVTLRSH